MNDPNPPESTTKAKRGLSRAAEAALRESEQRYRFLADAMPQIVWTARPDGSVDYYNQHWYDYTGLTFEQAHGGGWQQVLHPDDLEDCLRQWGHAVASGEPYEVEIRLRRAADGAYRWHLARAEPRRDTAGRIIQWVGTDTDIHDRKLAEQALREQSETLETVNRIGQVLSAELDLQKLVQAVTDAATELTGAQFGAFFYNVIDQRGEAFTLYTISGVPREAFAKFPMPRNTEVFAPTFHGQGIVRSDDITADPRYGRNAPYSGMPSGHLPVKSYLAVPVISRSGKVLGGLFFGHPQPGVFTEREEHTVQALVAQAAIAMDNAHLYQEAQREIEERKRVEAALRESEARTRGFLRDVLASVTEDRLRLCDSESDLPPPLPLVGESYTLSPRSLRLVRRQVQTLAETLGLSDERCQDLITAVGEATMNAVIHAGGGEARVCSDGQNTIQIWVEDTGTGIALDSLHRATLERGFTTAGTLGYGFWMMLKTADRAWLLTGPGGTTVVLEQDRIKLQPTWLRKLH